MTSERLFSLRNPWFTGSVGLTGAIAAVSAVVGLVWLPQAQTNLTFDSIWDVVCSAAGVPRAATVEPTVEPGFKTSEVVLAMMPGRANALSIGRGATLAQRCAICHGPQGVSDANSPNLAGQNAGAIHKQLRDFKSGARVNSVMAPFTDTMREQEMVDLAAYYAYLPLLPSSHPDSAVAVPRIVTNGAPMRNIAPCAACHGGVERSGSPWLGGQSAIYIRAQLKAFASGSRHNDIGQQMRNVARQMTFAEMDEVSRYYATRP